jgi:alkylation response protein AidB-like acyl-CoA dehydrogenase
MFGGQPFHDSPIFRLPTSVFGFALTAVPLGIARHTIAALQQLALAKKLPPPRLGLAEQGFTQYTVAKAEAMTEAARLAVRAAFSALWREVREDGQASMASRARLRRALVHAVETSVEAVGMCCRAAGGDALFENQPFERALRDVNAAAGHIVFQRAMMEDCGRVALGLPPLLPMF